ncbi:MAG: short-chain fatty acid transporter [Deltaproteobacteria bacterium]|nr:short-chain fatty acid transporter [Deltaproteobacteria bacterium]
MIRAMGEYFSDWAKKYMPDPWLFAILLSFLTYVLGLIFTKSGPFDMILHWYKGFWELLAFAMQMCLILITGYALATAPVVKRALDALARVPQSNSGAVYLIVLVAIIAGYINWGLGLVVGAMFAKEVATQGYLRKIPMHYPLLGAAGYIGLAIWHGGLSGSAPLLVATKGHFLEKDIGIIPIVQTLFSPLNIGVFIVMIIVLPFLAKALAPKEGEELITIDKYDPTLLEKPKVEETNKGQWTIAEWLENSRIIIFIVVLAGFIYIVHHFNKQGFDLNLNIVNFIFLIVGMLLHKTPISYLRAVTEGTKGCAGIILQFPFYAGIMGMMKYSGLVGVIAGWFVAISTSVTYPVWTYISACIINIFVPSGGGQWAVQGPIAVKAAQAMQLSVQKTLMAVAYGDQWTNLFQPFWALPLLGITRLKVRDIMGYCIAIMFVGIPIFVLLLLLLPA